MAEGSSWVKVEGHMTMDWSGLHPDAKFVHGPVKATIGVTPETAVTVEFEYKGANVLNLVVDEIVKRTDLDPRSAYNLYDINAEFRCDYDPTFHLVWFTAKEE